MKTEIGESGRLTLTVAEASAALNISKATTYMLISTGRLPALRISPRRILVPVAPLMAMLEAGVSGKVNDAD